MLISEATRGEAFSGAGRFVRPSFGEVYDETVSFVWWVVRRLGVSDSELDDVSQDVFTAVHRRLGTFEGRCSLKTWVHGILLGIVRNHRRRLRRKGHGESLRANVVDASQLVDPNPDPSELASRAEADRLLRALLGLLSDELSSVFIMAELDGMTAPQIAKRTKLNVNTVYSRLRIARIEFRAALHRLHTEGVVSDEVPSNPRRRRRRRRTARPAGESAAR